MTSAAGPPERIRALSDGSRIPSLGLGVWEIADGDDVTDVVRTALEVGYRHIDTAQAYGNESGVGRGLRQSGVPREQVFITTKFDPRASDPVAEAERSLERLGTEWLDLYLVHYPLGGPTRAWRSMELARQRGLTRSIGVSNFGVDELEAVMAGCEDPPVVNQVQLSPFQYRAKLLAACTRFGIAAEAYSPLTRGADLDHPLVLEVADHNARTPAQVLLRWALQRGLIVIPKSVQRKRMVENSRIYDFSLSSADVGVLDGLDRTGEAARALENPWWTATGRARARLWSIRERFRR